MRRVWHPFTAWECIAAGMYLGGPPSGRSADECRAAYRDFLGDCQGFRRAMERVAREWPVACEHFLTNPNINRIAWLGQSAMCISTGISSIFRGGFMLLTPRQQYLANLEAQRFLNEWTQRYRRTNQRLREDVEGQRIRGGYSGQCSICAASGKSGTFLQGHLFSDIA